MTERVFIRRVASLTIAAGILALSASAQESTRSRTSASVERTPALGAYFPLAPGHTWVYRFDGAGAAETVTVETGDVAVRGAHRYVEVRGFAEQDVWLRTDAQGRVLRYLPETGGEAVWYDFSTPAGGGWRPQERDTCTGAAQVRSIGSKIETPAGAFERTFAIGYDPGICADAGIEAEVFAYGVGLVRRTIMTIAGPRTMSLARTSIVPAAPSPIEVSGFSVNLEIDRPIYTPNLMPPTTPERAIPRMRAKFSVVNVSRTPVNLTFPSGQIFDFAIRTARGERVYTWSADKLFPAVITEVELGRQVFSVDVPLTQDGSSPLRPGLYVAEAWMVAPEGQPYKASTAFEVTEPAF